jgi:tRNA U54 and U55 pseudouridine synthase Pus10
MKNFKKKMNKKTDLEKLTDLINNQVLYIVEKLEKTGKEKFKNIEIYTSKKSPLYKMIYDELMKRMNDRLSKVDPSIFPDDLFKK